MTRDEAVTEMLAWANGTKSYNNLFLSVESGPSQRPQTLAALAVADAAEVVKWAAVAMAAGESHSQKRPDETLDQPSRGSDPDA